jgi:hypothetical protein
MEDYWMTVVEYSVALIQSYLLSIEAELAGEK